MEIDRLPRRLLALPALLLLLAGCARGPSPVDDDDDAAPAFDLGALDVDGDGLLTPNDLEEGDCAAGLELHPAAGADAGEQRWTSTECWLEAGGASSVINLTFPRADDTWNLRLIFAASTPLVDGPTPINNASMNRWEDQAHYAEEWDLDSLIELSDTSDAGASGELVGAISIPVYDASTDADTGERIVVHAAAFRAAEFASKWPR
jgi:hypothetical protein